MWTCAQVDESSTSVRSNFTAIWNFVGNQTNLEWVVSEKIKSFLFCANEPLKLLFILDDLVNSLFNILIVGLLEYIFARV